jgi:outer membrane usher protein
MAGAKEPHDLYLEVSVNGELTPSIVHFREQNGRLSATGADLATLGLAIDKLGIAEGAIIRLDTVPGLQYHYDQARQRIDITLANGARRPYTIDSRQLPQVSPATSGRGLVLNYEAFAQNDAASRLSVWMEQRLFDPAGVFSNTGINYFDGGSRRYVRYDTSWSHSDLASLSTIRMGDTISSALSWSRSIRLAGFQWSSDFALRPDLITFPIPALSGSALVPTSLDLYVNNVQRFSTQIPSGPFVLNQVPGINGAGEATIVTRDALGQTISTSLPLYIDTQMLATGLSSYSVETGFLRRNYGANSFDYESNPAVSASWRRGIDDAITVEAHGEATSGLFNGGAGALVRLGMAGVINGSVSASAGHLAGTQVSLGYQLIEARFAIDAQSIRAFANYGDLAARDGSPVARATDRITVSMPFFEKQNLALSYIGMKFPRTEASHIGSLSYGINFGKNATLNLSAYQDFHQHDSHGVFLSFGLGFDDRTSLNVVAGSQNGQSYYNAQALRPSDYGGGWGWGAQAGESGGIGFRQAQLQYLGNAGQFTGLVQNLAGRSMVSFDALGSVVWMDGDIQFARRIYDGFALVSTNGVAGVPVLHENRPLGSTDERGYLLIPDLNAYQNNRVSIDTSQLPVDMRIDTTTLALVPQAQSGVLGHFPISRYAAASVIVNDAAGHAVAPGARVHHVESGADTVIGYDGLTFISNLQANNHLVLAGDGWQCTVQFTYQPPADHALPQIGPLTCQPQAVPAR